MVLIWIFARRRPPQIRAFGEVVGAQHPWSIVEFFADAWLMSSQKKWRRAAHYLFPTEHLKSPMFWIFAKKWQKSGFLKFEHLFTRARRGARVKFFANQPHLVSRWSTTNIGLIDQYDIFSLKKNGHFWGGGNVFGFCSWIFVRLPQKKIWGVFGIWELFWHAQFLFLIPTKF